jgi:hypothetical protein
MRGEAGAMRERATPATYAAFCEGDSPAVMTWINKAAHLGPRGSAARGSP